MNEITYEQAKKAKEVLIKYLTDNVDSYPSPERMVENKDKYIVLFALQQEYFLE